MDRNRNSILYRNEIIDNIKDTNLGIDNSEIKRFVWVFLLSGAFALPSLIFYSNKQISSALPYISMILSVVCFICFLIYSFTNFDNSLICRYTNIFLFQSFFSVLFLLNCFSYLIVYSLPLWIYFFIILGYLLIIVLYFFVEIKRVKISKKTVKVIKTLGMVANTSFIALLGINRIVLRTLDQYNKDTDIYYCVLLSILNYILACFFAFGFAYLYTMIKIKEYEITLSEVREIQKASGNIVTEDTKTPHSSTIKVNKELIIRASLLGVIIFAVCNLLSYMADNSLKLPKYSFLVLFAVELILIPVLSILIVVRKAENKIDIAVSLAICYIVPALLYCCIRYFMVKYTDIFSWGTATTKYVFLLATTINIICSVTATIIYFAVKNKKR